MYEYLKTKQTDSPKHSVSHSVVQQRVISDRNSYADRFAKPEYYPIRETSSVVQMCREDDSYEEYSEEPDDEKKDPTYSEPRSDKSFLSSTKARRKMGEIGTGGEAHHIIPRHIVKKLKPETYGDIDQFNDEWNIIMLHGSIDKDYNVIHEFKGNKEAPPILHRDANECGHSYYDDMVKNMINQRQPKCIEDYKDIAQALRKKIETQQAFALDFLE